MRSDNFLPDFNTSIKTEFYQQIDLIPKLVEKKVTTLPGILFLTTFPPRECGIATYSQDLIKAINIKFSNSFEIIVCALESNTERHTYPKGNASTPEIKYTLDTDNPYSYRQLARAVIADDSINMVMIQHEFGLFAKNKEALKKFISDVAKPVILTFHTVLPLNKDENGLALTDVQELAALCQSITVMTNNSAQILINDYKIAQEKVSVIEHGTHLVAHGDKNILKKKYNLEGKKVLSTFGLLSSGKSIETTLEALPAIVQKNSDVVFLIIGKTHPSVVKSEGEQYRLFLEEKVKSLKLESHVKFINYYLPLADLLEFLQLSDIYVFTSKDPNQAVSGTFSYALSCGCPIISTPIPHALEVLETENGIIFDFGDSTALSKAIISLLSNEELRKKIGSKGLGRMAVTSWENTALAHAKLFKKVSPRKFSLNYSIPEINLDHVKRLTTHFGMIQFCKINQPDLSSGYTIDDNARALVAMCQHFELTKNSADLKYIAIYLDFIKYCLQPHGNFLNYVDTFGEFTLQNSENLEDSNGRAIWALGFLISMKPILPQGLVEFAEAILKSACMNMRNMRSTRAIAFAIKGLYYSNLKNNSQQTIDLITELSNRLVQMFRHEATKDWFWFESYLTYANSILPEALLCAYLATGERIYRDIAKVSFDFLLTKVFRDGSIKVISNKGWLKKEAAAKDFPIGGEQPIDIAYTIMALSKFYKVFKTDEYARKMEIAFEWFLGNNHLNQIIYNPCTGGCYDGLEDTYVNLNQGAESTVSYLMARLTVRE